MKIRLLLNDDVPITESKGREYVETFIERTIK